MSNLIKRKVYSRSAPPPATTVHIGEERFLTLSRTFWGMQLNLGWSAETVSDSSGVLTVNIAGGEATTLSRATGGMSLNLAGDVVTLSLTQGALSANINWRAGTLSRSTGGASVDVSGGEAITLSRPAGAMSINIGGSVRTRVLGHRNTVDAWPDLPDWPDGDDWTAMVVRAGNLEMTVND